MTMSADEKIIFKVREAKEKLTRLERRFDDLVNNTQEATSRKFDVSEIGKAVSIARNAAEETRKIVKEREVVVHMLDISCRELLPENPSIESIEAVYLIIKEYNAFEIDFAISISVGREDAGSGSRELDASLTAKMIESFWESKLINHPDYADYLVRKENAKIAHVHDKASALTRLEAEKKNLLLIRRKAQKRINDIWRAKVDEIDQRREARIRAKVDSERASRLKKMEEDRARSMEQAETTKRDSLQKKQEAENKLSTLGIFRLGDKKVARQTIESMQAAIEQADKDMATAEEKYAKQKQTFDADMETFAEKVKKQVEQSNPYPPKPASPDSLRGEDNTLSLEILRCMMNGERYTVNELMAASPILQESNNAKISEILRSMESFGEVDRKQIQNMYYFFMADQQ